jgi:hypothetical protein
MSPTRIAGIIQPLSVTQSSESGMIWVLAFGDNDDPAVGASVAVGAANGGSVGMGEVGTSVGSTFGAETFIIMFVNVVPGESTVTLTAPAGETCVGGATTPVFAGKASLVHYLCE